MGKYMWIILSVLAIMSCRGKDVSHSDVSGKEINSVGISNDYGQEAAGEADSLLCAMSLEEKAAQVLVPALYATDDYYTLEAAARYAREGIGGIMLLKGDTASARRLADTLEYHSRIPAFMAIDAEWGLGMRLRDAPRHPLNAELGAGATEESIFETGRQVGAQCRALGITMVLGPVVDVASPGSYIGRRSYGEDPRKVSDLAIAYARGLESEGVVSVAKHFPGHGAAVGDSHRGKPVIYRSLHDLDSIDLYPFRRYIEEGLSAVMVGHLAVPAIDPALRPAAVSQAVVTDLLRDDLHFDGLVLTDAMGMEGSEKKGAVEALKAGADIVLSPVDAQREKAGIVAAVHDGDLDERILDSHVRRILYRKMLMRHREK